MLLLTPRPPLLVNSVNASKVAKPIRPNSRGEGEPVLFRLPQWAGTKLSPHGNTQCMTNKTCDWRHACH